MCHLLEEAGLGFESLGRVEFTSSIGAHLLYHCLCGRSVALLSSGIFHFSGYLRSLVTLDNGELIHETVES